LKATMTLSILSGIPLNEVKMMTPTEREIAWEVLEEKAKAEQ